MITIEVAAARAREERRENARRRAAAEVATWPAAERDRLQRDFDRAARQARFISNRGHH